MFGLMAREIGSGVVWPGVAAGATRWMGHVRRTVMAESAHGNRMIARELMKRTSWIGVGLVAAGLGFPLAAWSFQKPQRQQLPNFDKRLQAAAVAPAVDPVRAAAAAADLRAKVPGVRIDMDPLLGTPKFVGATTGFLTGPSGSGNGVRPQTAAAFAGDDPHRPVKAFLSEHAALFGVGAEALAEARIAREYVTAHNGLRTVVWEQQLEGIGVFERVLIANITRKAELVNISSQFVPNLAQAADRGTPNRAAAVATPPISAAEAIVRAAPFVDAAVNPADVLPLAEAVGRDHQQRLAAPALSGPVHAKLVWLPMSRNALRLCWDLILVSRARGEGYRVLVDAQTGDVVLRRNLTQYISPITLNVYTSDSPSPFSPGHTTPSSAQPPLVSRTLLTLTALSTNASPNGWIDDGRNETVGNNVDAHTDRNDDDQPDLPRPQGSPSRVFNFPLDLNQSPLLSSNAVVVNLFYWNNFVHDRLYELGFTEAAGNFQTTNFNRGGLGNDAVQADAQDGGGFNNANMLTLPDGLPPRMQMYLFDFPNPDRDGSLDAEIVIHEYVHGLSNRRVGGGVLISELQTAGMGEGWSDFYALSLLSQPTDNVDGNYAAGGYATFQLAGLTQNYYFGIRRYPYSTDMTKNPLTFKDIDPNQASPHTGVPLSPLFTPFTPALADEVHNQGEVWCSALWEVRANLVKKWGYSIGNQLALQLVTDGMSLSPANPNFLQARDAIIQADLVNNDGANFIELWQGFAKRGMGLSATSPSSRTTVGVFEAFDAPSGSAVVRVGNVEIGEGNSGITNAVFTVTLSAPTINTVTVSYATSNVTAAAGFDFFGTSGTLTFLPGVTTQTVAVAVIGDISVEQNEVFHLNLLGATNAAVPKPTAVGTILNDDGPILLISDASVSEGDTGTTNMVFTVTLTQPASVSVAFSTTNGTATSGVDFQPTNGTVVFFGGVTNQTISVPVFGDGVFESNETFFVTLTNASGATIFRSTGVGTILDEDGLLSVDDVTLLEGSSGTTSAVFTVRLNRPSTNTVSVNFATAQLTAGSGFDFVATNGTLIFSPGTTNRTVAVTVISDTLNEPDESFAFNLSSPTNGLIVKGQALCTITNDDPIPGVFITNQVQVSEGNSGANNAAFTVFLTAASGQVITVNFATGVGTAGSGTDYIATSGTLVFPTNTTSRTIVVPIIGDASYESNETFTVRISGAVNATNVASQDVSTGTIVNDDAMPILAVNDVSLYEGNSGTTTAVFTVTLSPASGVAAAVNFATGDLSPQSGAATAGGDYVATNGVLTFPAGATSRTVAVQINGDTEGPPTEGNETFFLDLSGATDAVIAKSRGIGSILNDDGPVLTVSDVTVVEGNSGTTNAIFTVSLSQAGAATVTVNFATAGVTATPGLDFVSTNGTLTFAPGETATNITVVVNGEAFLESDETFTLTLSGAVNATVGKAQGVGTIKDDDTIADLSLSVARGSFTGAGETNFVGHHISYLFAVTNLGPLTASNVVVTSSVPASVALVSWASSAGTFSNASGVFTFDLGTLASNTWATGAVVVSPTVTGRFTNFVGVVSPQPDPNTPNNSSNLVSTIVIPEVILTNGAALSLIAESISPANGAFEAGETVTVALALRNTGNVATTNLVAALLPGGGVNNPTAAQSYGIVGTNSVVTRNFGFAVSQSGGQIVTAFQLSDGTNNLGTVSFTNRTASTSSFTNTAAVTIPDAGTASVYPSTITVSGIGSTQVVNKVTVTLRNVNHTFPADIDVLLVGPTGQSVMLMSDAGGGDHALSGVNLTFDDDASGVLPQFGQITTGAHRPTDYDTADALPPPAPSRPYASALAAFDGTDPNGVWSLYVADDANGDSGSILGGWSLSIETVAPVNNTAALAVSVAASPDPVHVGSNLVYTVVVTNRGPGAATFTTLSNALPFQAGLAAAPVFSQGSVTTNGNLLVFSLGKIAAGASVTGTITVTNMAAGTATNVATVASAETDLNLADNTAVTVSRINRVVALASQSSAVLTNGQFSLTLTGETGLTYVIEVSTNLVDWTPIYTNPPGTSPTVNFVDSNAPPGGLRFYRAVER